MFLHLGNDNLLRTQDIIGIFDLDTSTISKHTRNFLKCAQDNNNVFDTTQNLPKSFIISHNKNKRENKIYISQISASTLKKRNDNIYNIME